MTIISMLITGLIVGAIARFLVPGKDPMGIVGTLVLGIVGSLLGGWASMAFGDGSGVGIIGGAIGAVIVLLIYRAVTNRGGAHA